MCSLFIAKTISNCLSRAATLTTKAAIAVFLFSPLLSFGDLRVEWINDNEIHVWGYGTGYDDITNELGVCSNCTYIAPAELTAGMDVIISNCDAIADLNGDIDAYCRYVLGDITNSISDIRSFIRLGGNTNPSYSDPVMIQWTNYLQTVDNTQVTLAQSYVGHAPPYGGSSDRLPLNSARHYSNGIYDYANQYVLPELSSFQDSVEHIKQDSEDIDEKVEIVKTKASEYRNLPPCYNQDGSANTNAGASAGCPWTTEQIEALIGYLECIDQDQHKRYSQLSGISNDLAHLDQKFDSYARLFYQDGTIRITTPGHTFTNVYFSGHSDEYAYDKSNILQRIELLLYGVSVGGSISNALEQYTDETQSEADSFYDNLQTLENDTTSTIVDKANQFEDLADRMKELSHSLIFIGSPGSIATFDFGLVPDLSGNNQEQYISVGSGFIGSGLGPFRTFCRGCFQLIYAVSFLFWLWYFYCHLFKYCIVAFRFVIDYLNQALAS